MDPGTSADLRTIFGHFATGVTIVTTVDAAGERVGMTANSFSSLSLEPPLLLWSISRRSSNFEAFSQARCFAVHVLHAGQLELARVFSTRGAHRFAGVDTVAGSSGAPLLTDFHARFDCETHARYEGGDHVILLGRVLSAEQREGRALLFYRGRFAAMGSDAGS